jgi:hypothetical protein
VNLKNENIGVVAGMLVVAIGLLLTEGDPGDLEAAVIGILMLVVAFGLAERLNLRDGVYGRSSKR